MISSPAGEPAAAITAEDGQVRPTLTRVPRWRFVGLGVAKVFTLFACLLALPEVASWSLVLLALLAAPLVVALFISTRAFFAWSAYVLGFVAFVVIRAKTDNMGMPTFYAYPLVLDQLLGLGTLPTVLLQRWIDHGVVHWIMVIVYISYFVVPPLLGAVLLFNPRHLQQFVLAMLLTYAAGLIVHALLPTAPPWMASEMGLASPLDRLLLDVAYSTAPEAFDAGYQASNNDVAAMPSMHMAVTAVAAIGGMRFARNIRYVFVAYLLLMGISIVYLGEHYVVDALGGLGIAALSWWIVARRVRQM